MKPFLFMRHGETDWNKARVYQGQNDIPLNATGRAQAQARANERESLQGIDAIFVSPLLRAKETAQIIAQSIPDVPMIDVPEFMECQSVESARYVLTAKGVESMPSFDRMPDSDETVQSLTARVKTGLKIVDDSLCQRPLIVAHGGVAAIIAIIYGQTPAQLGNCELVEYKDRQLLRKNREIL